MAVRWYVVPKDGTGIPGENNPYRAKYFVDSLGRAQVASGKVDSRDYGLEPVFLVVADVTNGEHNTISANSDVVSLPVNIDAAVGVNLATVTSKLDALGFPSDWVDATTTYRQIIRQATRCIQLAQRLHGPPFGVRLLPVGISLNSTVGSLTANQRQRMADAIAEMGGTASQITLGMTLRQAIKTLTDQIPFIAKMLDVDL